MHHQNDPGGSVEANRLSDLVEEEFAIGFMLGRCQRLRASGDLDRIGILNPDAFQVFRQPLLKAIIEAPDDGRVTVVLLPGSVEMEYLFSHMNLEALPGGASQYRP